MKKPNDKVYTPEDLAKEVIALCPLVEGDVVLDAWAGGDVFFNNYPDFVEKHWCEIERGRDFFDFEGEVDWVISNPPYSKLTDIYKKLAGMCRKGICLITGVNNVTPTRFRFIEEQGFSLTAVEIFLVRSWGGFNQVVLMFERDKPSIRRLSRFVYEGGHNPNRVARRQTKTIDQHVK